jgi:hypothetical protein
MASYSSEPGCREGVSKRAARLLAGAVDILGKYHIKRIGPGPRTRYRRGSDMRQDMGQRLCPHRGCDVSRIRRRSYHSRGVARVDRANAGNVKHLLAAVRMAMYNVVMTIAIQGAHQLHIQINKGHAIPGSAKDLAHKRAPDITGTKNDDVFAHASPAPPS